MVWRNLDRSCESRHGNSEKKVQNIKKTHPNTEYISMLFTKTNKCNIIYCWNKPDKHRYFNIADKQVFQFVKYMLPLVWGEVSPRAVFRKHKQLSLSPDTYNMVIIIFLHDKLLQVSKLPLSYVSLDSEFIRIAFSFHLFGFADYFIWAKKAKF